VGRFRGDAESWRTAASPCSGRPATSKNAQNRDRARNPI